MKVQKNLRDFVNHIKSQKNCKLIDHPDGQNSRCSSAEISKYVERLTNLHEDYKSSVFQRSKLVNSAENRYTMNKDSGIEFSKLKIKLEWRIIRQFETNETM